MLIKKSSVFGVKGYEVHNKKQQNVFGFQIIAFEVAAENSPYYDENVTRSERKMPRLIITHYRASFVFEKTNRVKNGNKPRCLRNGRLML